MITIQEFKEYLQMSEIEKIRGKGTELITLFLPKKTIIHEVVSKIKFQKNECKNIKSKRTRKALETALNAIQGYLDKNENKLESASIIFSGLVNQNLFFKVFNTEGNIPFKYCCSDKFLTSGFYDGLNHTSYYLIVLDLNGATVGLKSTRGIEVLRNFDSYIPSKTKKGGQSSRRYAEIRVNETRELFGRIASYCRSIDTNHPRPFLLGGSPPTVDNFFADKHLPNSIKNKTSGPYYLQTDCEAGLEELVSFSKSTQIEREKKIQQELLSKKNYSPKSFEKFSQLVFLVPISLLKDYEELKILFSADDTCRVVLIEDYTPLGAQYNTLRKLRVLSL